MSLAVASEYTWNKGYLWTNIHVGTASGKLPGDFSWWSVGKVMHRRWLDDSQTYPHYLSMTRWRYRASLIQATLRHIEDEPMKPILLRRGRWDDEIMHSRAIEWRWEMRRRAIDKYGAKSGPVKLLMRHEEDDEAERENLELVDDYMDKRGLPDWEDIMGLWHAKFGRISSSRTGAAGA